MLRVYTRKHGAPSGSYKLTASKFWLPTGPRARFELPDLVLREHHVDGEVRQYTQLYGADGAERMPIPYKGGDARKARDKVFRGKLDSQAS